MHRKREGLQYYSKTEKKKYVLIQLYQQYVEEFVLIQF
jgi:hypothetical protein